MKIKLDENLPLQAATFLKNFGHDVHTPHDERLIGRADEEIWDAAQKDLDFSDLRRFAPGSHHGILLLRLRSPTRRRLAARIKELFQEENVGEWAGSLVVATELKTRVRKPEAK